MNNIMNKRINLFVIVMVVLVFVQHVDANPGNSVVTVKEADVFGGGIDISVTDPDGIRNVAVRDANNVLLLSDEYDCVNTVDPDIIIYNPIAFPIQIIVVDCQDKGGISAGCRDIWKADNVNDEFGVWPIESICALYTEASGSSLDIKNITVLMSLLIVISILTLRRKNK